MKTRFVIMLCVICAYIVNADAQPIRKMIEVEDFSRIRYEVSTKGTSLKRDNCKIIISSGNENKVGLIADQHLQDIITFNVIDDVLHINAKDDEVLNNKSKFIIYIKVENLKSVDIEGVVSVVCKEVKTKNLKIDIAGVANLNIDELEADKLYVDIEGICNADLSGKVKAAKIDLDGIGRVDASQLIAENFSSSKDGFGRNKYPK